jgi:hypothetical protein
MIMGDRKAFISHAAQDGVIAARLAEVFRQHGIRTFVAPEDITPGEDWSRRLRKEIAEAGTFVMVRSDAGVQSNNVQMELGAAWAADKPIVFVIPPGQDSPSAVPMPLDGVAMGVLRMDGLSVESIGDTVRRAVEVVYPRQSA